MNTEPRFLLGKLSDGTPIVVTRLKEGVAFELVHIKLAQAYAQIDAIGFPPRPSGTPRTVAAGERVACFRCEAQALEAAGAIANGLERHRTIAVRNLSGRVEQVALGDLIDFITAEVKAALLEEGIITQADIDAREERRREVARIGGRDMIRIVQ